MQSDQLDILVRVMAADRKRIHAAFDFYCAALHRPGCLGRDDAAARAPGSGSGRRLPSLRRSCPPLRLWWHRPAGLEAPGPALATHRVASSLGDRPPALSAAAIRRLLRPQSVALIGGSWTDTVAAEFSAIGYRGKVWRVNPNRSLERRTCRYYRSVDELPGSPDQAFVAVPRARGPGCRRGAGAARCRRLCLLCLGILRAWHARRPALSGRVCSAAPGRAVLRAQLLRHHQFFRSLCTVAGSAGRRFTRARCRAHLPERHAWR